ncbi:unnamed protein product [Orchesella dallaii]|uniref:Uncharacterized protein n=1 Tax=Orchesella dallaii TaxID=48710 RepID=A0ABP1QCV1_9HEXA
MKSRHRSTFSLSSPLFAVAVGVLCVAYIQLSDSAPTSESSSTTSKSTSGTKPTRITTMRTGKQRVEESPAGRLKASDIKACISKAFCEVNSASRKPNYAVNQEFFDIMDQIRSLSDEDIDSGSASAEYDEEEEEEDDDVESSEESSSERGYPGPPPPGYHRMSKKMKKGGNSTSVDSVTNSTVPIIKKIKSKGTKDGKKKMKVKTVKKYVNGTFISVPKRRHSRIETDAEKAEKVAFVTRKQREMGQVNDLAALIRISADIGLTLRSPRKCRTLFNKCTMTHEQIVDLFNQTLMAVTTPATDTKVGSTSTKVKVHTTQSAPAADEDATEVVEITTASQAPSTTSASTTSSPTTTTIDNRASKSRHDFSDEDVEYMTDTEIQPVATYALFVNDPVDDTMRTAETDVNVQETFKKYANTFPAEASFPVDLPTLRKKSNKVSKNKKKKSSFNRKMAPKRKVSSEEDDDDDDDEDDEPTSASTESERKSGFRIESPYPGYRVSAKDEDLELESAEPSSAAKQESSEGILPPLVQKVTVKPLEKKPSEDDDDGDEDEENDEESEESAEEAVRAKQNKKYKKKAVTPASPAPVEEESSEEDDVEVADDDQQSPPPWAPVYQMYMNQKQKQGYKKKQKGPYKGGEHPYDDSPHAATPSKKPWAGSDGSHELGGIAASSHESMYGDAPYHGHAPPYGAAPPGASQEGAEKPGFFQSIMSWFTGGGKTGELSSDSPYPPAAMTQHSQHQHQHPYSQESPTGSPWPSQPDPGNVGHYQYGHHPHQHTPSQYRHRDSSEDSDEDDVEEAEVEEFLPKKRKNKNKRRRYRGRSDSIINSGLKKSSSSSRKTGPPAPVVVVPKETKPNSSGSNPSIGVYEPNSHYDTLIKADGGITSGSNLKGKNSEKENKRTKKETIKPKQKKKNQKESQRAHSSIESQEDDDEAYSSEELFNRQVNKLKSEKIGASNNVKSNSGKQNNDASTTTEASFPKYFESMFGNEERKDPFKPVGKDDGSLLYGFDSLSSTLSATEMDLASLPKKKGTYKVNKTKKKKKGTTPPVKFNQKEVLNSSEEDQEKKKK